MLSTVNASVILFSYLTIINQYYGEGSIILEALKGQKKKISIAFLCNREHLCLNLIVEDNLVSN